MTTISAPGQNVKCQVGGFRENSEARRSLRATVLWPEKGLRQLGHQGTYVIGKKKGTLEHSLIRLPIDKAVDTREGSHE